jgi:ATP-dependent DNA helicase RecG
LTQVPLEEVKKTLNTLSKKGLLQLTGKDYMLSARVYENIKTTVEYTQDKTIQYIKAREMIRDYISYNKYITMAIVARNQTFNILLIGSW